MRNTFFAFIIISIFSTGIISAQDPAVATAQKLPVNAAVSNPEPTKGYMIGPGDEISVKVLGEPQYDFVTVVDENGKIEISFADAPIVAKCKTERELRVEISNLLATYLRTPQINLRTEKKSRPKITIYGEVRTPQQIELTRRATLIELIAFSGGITENAGGMIQVFRTQRPICSTEGDGGDWKPETGDATEVPSRIYSLASVKLGKEEANPVILPGDVIVVQRASPVYITGEVVAPQAVLLKEGGTSLVEAIGMVGGLGREAKSKDIKIYRRTTGSKERNVLLANLDLIKAREQQDILLEPYDIVEVDKAKKPIGLLILEFALGTSKQVIAAAANNFGYMVVY